MKRVRLGLIGMLLMALVTLAWAANDTGFALGQLQAELEALIQRVSPSVVTLFSEKGLGSGFLVDESGLIATNWHVIGGSKAVRVLFPGEPVFFHARVLGGSPVYDLALVELEERPGKMPKPLVLGDSDKLRRGELVLALGSPYGLQGSVTWGIVSAVRPTVDITGRPIYENDLLPEVIQIQAPIYPGNSGGPLVNLNGEVVGLNTYGLARSEMGFVNFAVPVNYLKRNFLIFKSGRVLDRETVLRTMPRMGAEVLAMNTYPQELREQFNLLDYGLMVQSVREGSPAERAGLRPATRFARANGRAYGLNGDILVEADGQPLFSVPQLRGILLKSDGKPVKLTFFRRGTYFGTTVVPERGEGK